MKRDSIQDSTRYIVSGLHRGGVIPGMRSEMWKDVYIEPGSTIEGAIWGNELKVFGPDVHISESVYSRGGIRISHSDKGEKKDGFVNFNSSVVSPDSVIVDDNVFKCRFNTDIYGGILNLKKSFVYGNIYATNAVIKDSVVLGGIYCKKKLELSNSIVFTFDAQDTVINGNLSVLAPFALSKNSLEINGDAKAISFFDLMKDGENPTEGFVELNGNDIFRLKMSSLEGEDGEDGHTYVLSFSERLLNSDDILKHFKKNRKIVEDFTLQSHLNDSDRKYFEENVRVHAETRFWKIIEHGIEQRELSGTKPYDELLEKIEQGINQV